MRYLLLSATLLAPLPALAQQTDAPTSQKHHRHKHHTELEKLIALLPWIQSVDPALAAEIEQDNLLESDGGTTPPQTNTISVQNESNASQTIAATPAAPTQVAPRAQSIIPIQSLPADQQQAPAPAKAPTITLPAPTAPPQTVPAISLTSPGKIARIPVQPATTSNPSTDSSTQPSVPAPTIPVTPAVFAQPGCQGQTFFDNFRNDPTLPQWNFGGTGALSSGNGGFASYQSSTQNNTETTGPNGLTLSILPESAPNGAAWQAGLMSAKAAQTYGYFQAVVDVNSSMLQPGMSFAFWLLGDTMVPGSAQSWPSEIDSAEDYSTTLSSSLHSGFTSNTAANYVYNLQPGQYTYSVDWNPNTITWYMNGQQVAQAPTPADFHVPMNMILGTAATNASGYTSAPQPGASGSLTVEQVSAYTSMDAALACVPTVQHPNVTDTPVASMAPQSSLEAANSLSTVGANQ